MTRSRTSWIIALAAIFIFAACVSPDSAMAAKATKSRIRKGIVKETRAERFEEYRIGPEDVLEVLVWKNTDLSKVVIVRPDGMISLPLIGDIRAGGRSPRQLRDSIVKKLKVYQETVIVSVIVEEVNSHRVFLLGEVENPGSYQLKSRTTLLQSLALGGGFTKYASKSNVVLIRRKDGGGVEKIHVSFKDLVYKKGNSIILKPGDTIFVP